MQLIGRGVLGSRCRGSDGLPCRRSAMLLLATTTDWVSPVSFRRQWFSSILLIDQFSRSDNLIKTLTIYAVNTGALTGYGRSSISLPFLSHSPSQRCWSVHNNSSSKFPCILFSKRSSSPLVRCTPRNLIFHGDLLHARKA